MAELGRRGVRQARGVAGKPYQAAAFPVFSRVPRRPGEGCFWEAGVVGEWKNSGIHTKS